MGYIIEFAGRFNLNKPLAEAHLAYLEMFSGTRRMKRDAEKLVATPDPIRVAAMLPIGPQGGYFVGSTEYMGQDYDSPSVIDGDEPPEGQPGLWCFWSPNPEGTAIGCWEPTTFHYFSEWLRYVITHFLEPWGYTITGEVTLTGEDDFDLGKIVVTGNWVEEFLIDEEFEEEDDYEDDDDTPAAYNYGVETLGPALEPGEAGNAAQGFLGMIRRLFGGK